MQRGRLSPSSMLSSRSILNITNTKASPFGTSAEHFSFMWENEGSNPIVFGNRGTVFWIQYWFLKFELWLELLCGRLGGLIPIFALPHFVSWNQINLFFQKKYGMVIIFIGTIIKERKYHWHCARTLYINHEYFLQKIIFHG